MHVFPGKRWCKGLLNSCALGAGTGMSESGFVKCDLFETYITEHLAKYARIEKGSNRSTFRIL